MIWAPPTDGTAGTTRRRGRPRGDTRTPVLDRFGRDLTAEARAGRLDPVVGREREVAAVLEILGRRTKNNPVLVGDPGVGKTAIVEGIAARIAAGTRARAAGAARRGHRPRRARRRHQVPRRVRGAAAPARRRGRPPPTAASCSSSTSCTPSSGRARASRARWTPRTSSSRRWRGASCRSSARRRSRSTAATSSPTRRWSAASPRSPSTSRPIEQTVAILDGLKGRYEDHHGVRLPEDTRRAAVELTARHVRDRFLPDKAIDALDTAAARVRLRRAEDPGAVGTTVTVTDIAQVVADRTGLPVAAPHRLRADPPARPRRPPATARRRPGPRARGRHRRRARRARGDGGAGTTGGVVPVRGPDRRRQDRARPRPGRGAARLRRAPRAPRPRRVPRGPHRRPPHRGAARLHRPRPPRRAHRGDPPDAVVRGAARRDREGAPGRARAAARGAGRGAADRRPRAHRLVRRRRRHHDQQPRARAR